MQKLLFILILLSNLLVHSFASELQEVESWAVMLSLGYQSSDTCETSRDQNEQKFQKFYRSSCLQSWSLYYYYICDKSNSFCKNAWWNLNLWTPASQDTNPLTSVSATGNPFASNVSVWLLPKLSQATTKLEWLSLSKLQLINSKLAKLSPNYKDKPALLNVIKYLQFETVRLINEKQWKLTWIDDILAAINNNNLEENSTWLTALQKQDTQTNGYGLGSNKTLTWTYKWKNVYIVDWAWTIGLPSAVNGEGVFQLYQNDDNKDKISWEMKTTEVYAIRMQTKKDYQHWKNTLVPWQRLELAMHLFPSKEINGSLIETGYSRIPWNTTDSEFTWTNCNYSWNISKTMSFWEPGFLTEFINKEPENALVESMQKSLKIHHCIIPDEIYFYLNIRVTTPACDKENIWCPITAEMQSGLENPWKWVKQASFKTLPDNWPAQTSINEWTSGSQIFWPQQQPKSLTEQRDPNGLHIYHNVSQPYVKKIELKPQTIKDTDWKNQKLYIANLGAWHTGIPSCMNWSPAWYRGPLTSASCAWENWWEKGEIYAMRIMLKKENDSTHTYVWGAFSDNWATWSWYNFSVSETPWDMESRGLNKLCKWSNRRNQLHVFTSGALEKGSKLMNRIGGSKTGKQILDNKDDLCILEKDKLYYLNVQFTSEHCKSNEDLCNVGLEVWSLMSPKAPFVLSEWIREQIVTKAEKNWNQYSWNTRVSRWAYILRKDGVCKRKNMFTNECNCPSWFSALKTSSSTNIEWYECINSDVWKVNGVCWTADWFKTSKSITYGQCSSWAFQNLSHTVNWPNQNHDFKKVLDHYGAYPWIITLKDWEYHKLKWTCDGIGHNTQSSKCSASYSKPAKKWVCWSSHEQTMSSKPTQNLCNVWKATNVVESQAWEKRYNWACQWENYWNAAFCHVKKK